MSLLAFNKFVFIDWRPISVILTVWRLVQHEPRFVWRNYSFQLLLFKSLPKPADVHSRDFVCCWMWLDWAELLCFPLQLLSQYSSYCPITQIQIFSGGADFCMTVFLKIMCDSLSNLFRICRAVSTMFRMWIAANLQPIRYSGEVHLAENFAWGVLVIFSPIWTPNSCHFFSITKFTGDEEKLFVVERRIRSISHFS